MSERGPVTFEPMELSRVIPARVKRIRFKWVNAHFSTMSPQWRAVRAKCSSPADSCDWCQHKFEDGESMGLGGPEKGKNLLLCQKCVATLAPSTPSGEPK